MDEVFAISLNSMHQDMNRVDRIALNLANAATPGYKREVVAPRPFVQVLDQMATSGTVPSSSSANSAAAMQVLLDHQPGTIKITGQPMDVALTGDGFFEVSTRHGLGYTRQGDFRLDAQGRLVTAQGYPVMGKDGDIYLTTQTPVIDAQGNIKEPNATTGPSETPIAQIKVVRFEDTKAMQRMGDGLLTPGTNLRAAKDSEPRMRQGALENANVSSLQEMLQLMQTMRHFESIQKITQGYDEMIGTAILKLGDLS